MRGSRLKDKLLIFPENFFNAAVFHRKKHEKKSQKLENSIDRSFDLVAVFSCIFNFSYADEFDAIGIFDC